MTNPTSTALICTGISRWKQPAVHTMLAHIYHPIRFVSSPAKALRLAHQHCATLGVWASHSKSALIEQAANLTLPVLRIEDGFLRSVGLGAAFTKPCSLVMDGCGIYYDPRTPSDLENLLNAGNFPSALITRAEHILAKLRQLRVTKYNIGQRSHEPLVPAGQRAILVPGQVEDDASIRFGSPYITTNLHLLEAVRKRHPAAYIIYKPHPDVAAGYRQGAIAPERLEQLANRTVTDRSITDLYDECHHVETMTSLAGFEALVRGLTVTTHGQPFYAGWGLTEDLLPHPRRGKHRSMAELVAATLLLYPRYIHPVTGRACSAEETLTALAEASATPSTIAHTLQHIYARSRHLLFGALDRRRRQ